MRMGTRKRVDCHSESCSGPRRLVLSEGYFRRRRMVLLDVFGSADLSKHFYDSDSSKVAAEIVDNSDFSEAVLDSDGVVVNAVVGKISNSPSYSTSIMTVGAVNAVAKLKPSKQIIKKNQKRFVNVFPSTAPKNFFLSYFKK
ncbi:unnamed protein product [Lathyrus oleraceus]